MSGAQQYLRKSSIVIGNAGGSGSDVSTLRCTFHIKRGDIQTPNTCDLRVYNLSDDTANKIQNEFAKVVVQAGYEGSFGVVFSGTIKQVRKGRVDGMDSYVDVTAADGDEAYNFAPCSFTLAAGSTQNDILASLIQSLQQAAGLQPPAALPTLSENGSVRGRVFFGRARDEMIDFAIANNLAWSIQDGYLTLIPLTGYLPGQIPVISPETGLIGVPEQTQSGISMRSLLNPNVKVGQLVKLDHSVVNLLRLGLDIESQALINPTIQQQAKTNADGYYYVMVAEHHGDTRGQDWYTDMICLAVDATIVAAPPVSPSLPENAIDRFG